MNSQTPTKQNSGFNKSSLIIIFGGILLLLAVVGAGTLSYILPATIDNSLSESFEGKLLPNLNSDLENIANEVERLLIEKKQYTLILANENFSTEKITYTNGLIAQLMPLAESFDVDGIVNAIEHQLEASDDLSGVRVRTEKDGEWIEFGDTVLSEETRLFKSEGKNEYAFVELQLMITTEKLKKAKHLEDESFTKLLSRIKSLTDSTIEETSSKSHEIKDALSSTVRWQIGATVAIFMVIFMVIFTGLVLFLLNKIVIKSLENAGQLLRQIADGDLTVAVETNGEDEVNQLLAAMRDMVNKMHANITTVAASTVDMSSAAEQMSVITEETNLGIQKQQMETDQVATAISQMTATVQEVTRNATKAAQAAQDADQEAHNGQNVVTKTINSINRLANDVQSAAEVIHKLENNTESIGAVLDVIKGIAEQTNLLALNAAIEAARAGEQGRGFAVVADEVRTLAARTQDSTREIESMIEQLQGGAKQAVQVMEASSEQAKATVDQAAGAGHALEAITSGITSISDMNLQIATASEEQTQATEEINRSVINISKVVAETSQGAQQTAEAGESYVKLAADLQGLVAQFKV
ncbi:MAG: methyl-accepting chemotaxis protein [endosymbiont of Escarpia spicata]|uniref:Methyl-accepting chemotaxis protein n=1 Tax=endosymbiont of Escarpia spicata TaxID=2200908 RepID=A0A370DIS7_9GAMM|nr:MAG: methyl-accepting chemotaxis protein [endosymbiont of Escarpia spicata]